MQQQETTRRINVSKWRLLWILIAAAWLFVFLKLIIGAVFEKNTSLVAAFSVTNPQEISAMVEVTASCPEKVLSQKECENLMEKVADSIGLKLDTEPEWTETEQRKELRFYKDALAADTELKVISLYMGNKAVEDAEVTTTKQYLYAKISLNESLDTVLAYKALLEKTMEELECDEISTTIQLVGDYAGYLPLERRNEITEDILDALGAEVVYEYRKEDLYTIYAYTASLDNYITVEGKKINLHIAMSQNENHYRTTLYLASPILPDTW
ncbi:MAG: YwmB family TATA-box binding protein [Lachnospiraceae bacterium]|nr:YwmB family TATA-box binding protein [Lachnospiraceae bacterium]